MISFNTTGRGEAAMSTTIEPHSTSITEKNVADGPKTQQVVSITLGSGPNFLDAWEIQEHDFNVVTRPLESDNTQRWVLTDMGGGISTIMQVSSGRYLDAYESASLDFRVVTRPQQNSNTQLWQLLGFGGGFFKIQQVSSGRFLEATITAATDFQVVTRPGPGNDLQVWQIRDDHVLPPAPEIGCPGPDLVDRKID
jgi:hypothetical protein